MRLVEEYATNKIRKGLYHYMRLPFGVLSACALFQWTMGNILQGLSQVAIYLEDVLLTGNTNKEHLDILPNNSPRRAYATGREKCVFQVHQVTYFGHRADKTGSHPLEDKVRVIKVLAHRWSNGEEYPIVYVSQTLADAEHKYAQIEEEGLAVIFGMKKFHQYLYGWEFVIVTDHKPVLEPLKEDKAVLPIASSRIQRWALILSAYKYKLEHHPRSQVANVDALNCLPLADTPPVMPPLEESIL
eukprot:g29392.t1